MDAIVKSAVFNCGFDLERGEEMREEFLSLLDIFTFLETKQEIKERVNLYKDLKNFKHFVFDYDDTHLWVSQKDDLDNKMFIVNFDQ